MRIPLEQFVSCQTQGFD
ncbi:hypothetical protein D048_4617A, partial [Vibrio parahaemolyticus VPTS-2009]